MTPPKVKTDTPAPATPPGVLHVADVARMWGVQPGTVSAYLKQSKATVGDKPGRYASNPVPAPKYSGQGKKGPWWPEVQRQQLIDWFASRPGLGHGTGGRRAGGTART